MVIEVMDPNRFSPARCWFCDKPLDQVFTTIVKRGINFRVHPECRPEALTVVVEDHAEFLEPGYPLG